MHIFFIYLKELKLLKTKIQKTKLKSLKEEEILSPFPLLQLITFTKN